MHRLAAVPGAYEPDERPAFVEQPAAPLLVLSSADTDLSALASARSAHAARGGAIMRGLNLAALSHPAVIDHYVRHSLPAARVVLVRLLGGRGHWSYGLECLRDWQMQAPGRHLIVLAGAPELDASLHYLGSLPLPLADALAASLRIGGPAVWGGALSLMDRLARSEDPGPPPPLELPPDPEPWDWRDDPGPRVGVVLYRAWLQADDLRFPRLLLRQLREAGLCPRLLWVSGLRDPGVQEGVRDLLGRERVDLVLCGTSFASVRFEEAGLGAPLWEALDVPVLQVLTSTQPRSAWQGRSTGLAPLDLTMQVALPELDGRITTRVAAFKEPIGVDAHLATALQGLVPDPERLDFIVRLALAWVRLRRCSPAERRIALVLANYPSRDGRLANGVGLDTPDSAAAILHWLVEAGYRLDDGDSSAPLPRDGRELMARVLACRTHDPEAGSRSAGDCLPLELYRRWWDRLPEALRSDVERRWGPPDADPSLVEGGFPIAMVRFGHVVLLVQPPRGYDRDPALSYHAPDLPPTHAYLAHYLWLRERHRAHAVVHVGKHGNLEWLPGKGLGLSPACHPELALGPMPHLYPFIVNDPGEGTQAKRRAQAVIIDHLTPPLDRAGLHGPLQQLEALMDEYWDCVQLGGERAGLLAGRIETSLEALALPELSGEEEREERFAAADGYLCELKEAQIRVGLHRFGVLPERERLLGLLACLCRPPLAGEPGLPQALALDLGLELDPWSAPEEAPLAAGDRERLEPIRRCLMQGPAAISGLPPLRLTGDAVTLLEALARPLLEALLDRARLEHAPAVLSAPVPEAAAGATTAACLERLAATVLPPLLISPERERQGLLRGLAGRRVAAGPSGAPTRGRPDVLPTGRNFYSVDLRGLPTEAAWSLGERSAAQLLDLYLLEEGEPLRSLALSVWGTATMRNGGEDIAQMLALMGVRPVWDGPTRRLVGLEVIPLSLLGRPRVDVTLRISGLFRDAFPQLVGWVNRATAMVAALEESESDNPLAAALRNEGQAARVYGSAPGAYGAGLQGLIESGEWEDRTDLGQAYLNWSGWRYEGDGEPVADRAGLERRLAGLQVVIHNQDNREHDLLDSDDYYQFHGGLAAAIAAVGGRRAQLWFGDHSRSERPRLHRVSRELDKVIRSRLLNPRWLEAMRGHGYRGGFEMAASIDYLFAYDASSGEVPAWSYGALCESWFTDPEILAFLQRDNPWALRDMAERLLEAHHRGLWTQAGDAQLALLRQLVLESEATIERGN
ncbi:cobaltochelatase subunit CobN [Synechococcus sp. RSCCF101]|uniref:cobaltochelatase subunit CobN n=1 Tax=Synechococcus sp. RSCCF101 TaxID=2511069 RepID=UPI001244A00C|nr:cobaltochelatase subunit CobN [Synechococcus sp. RSCCF101]QEY31727.1 cobaltochelatase subunit CobN [Synechococcus sp. RSCCF101]